MLVYQNTHIYDIISCFPTIINNLNYNIIIPNHKNERNIFLGNVFKYNKNLLYFCRNTSECSIESFINNDNGDLLKQIDGLTTSDINIRDNELINISLRKKIDIFIMSPKKDKYIFVIDNKVITNGIFINTYSNSYIKMFSSLNFKTRRTLTKSIDKIIKTFYQHQIWEWHMIKKESDTYVVPTKNGFINVNNKSRNLIDFDSINKNYIYLNNIYPFIESVILTYF